MGTKLIHQNGDTPEGMSPISHQEKTGTKLKKCPLIKQRKTGTKLKEYPMISSQKNGDTPEGMSPYLF